MTSDSQCGDLATSEKRLEHSNNISFFAIPSFVSSDKPMDSVESELLKNLENLFGFH